MTPILRDFPDQFHTPRLLVRAPRAGDGPAVYEAVQESLAALRAWPASLPWALAEPTPEASETHCRRGQAAWLTRTDLPMLIFRRDTGALVGATGLHRLDWAVSRFEVGYWCRRSQQGQGLMTEAVQGVLQFAFVTLGARRVDCRTDVQNLPSRRVAERAGMALEGVMRHERIDPDGTLRDTCLYAAVR
jgi:RimJ/RimL family protein N-acetyltransferase